MTCDDTILDFVKYDRGYHVLGTHRYGFVGSFKINRIPACLRKSESGIQLKIHSMVLTFINQMMIGTEKYAVQFHIFHCCFLVNFILKCLCRHPCSKG
uniref:DDE Tnp4 domain-containing protein n=1 Tax=Panagrellus redivivus TaxID=6233 RepID=A0A7E4VBI6_PANRE